MRTAAALIALSCLTLAACEREPDPRGVDRNEVLLQVVASGRSETRPDQARFTAGVQTVRGTAAAASTANNEVMNRVTAALQRLGVKEADIQTRQISLQRIDYGAQRGQFQANNMVEVRVRDLKTAGQAIAVTTEAGANVLSGPDMTIADPEAATHSAYAAAFKAARARADAYAKAGDFKISRVLAIRDAGGGYAPPPIAYGRATIDAMATEQAAAPVSPPMHAGTTVNQVSVRVDFALKPN